MELLSHRGLWTDPSERNVEIAFVRSFRLGFGTETDIRDRDGRPVISHDPPTGDALPLARFFELYKAEGDGLPLALNIKADGLQPLVAALVGEYAISNYYVFDMAVPDAVSYFAANMPTYTRHSDLEPCPAFYGQATGVWVDGFDPAWVTEAIVAEHVAAGKKVCVVSPELHGQAPEGLWRDMRAWRCAERIQLCTDRPTAVRELIGA